jgi:DNA-binding response OmpR family regulator
MTRRPELRMKIDGSVPHFSLPLSTALVVEPNDHDMAFVKASLTSAGFIVTATDNFKDAGALLVAAPPSLLVAEIRLGAYNGLQLAYRGKSASPPMAIVLTSAYPDPVLRRDVERMGATFVLKPVTERDFIAAVIRTALRKPGSGGTLEPVQPPFERRQEDRRQSSAADLLEAERRTTHRRRGLLAR